MATYGSAPRRGLPRVPGAEPWPPVGDATVAAPTVESVPEDDQAEAPTDAPAASAAGPSTVSEPPRRDASSHVALRQGLPRTPDGEPWPSAPAGAARGIQVNADQATVDQVVVDSAQTLPERAVDVDATPLRRGLPRAPGGELWPPAGVAAAVAPARPEPLEASAQLPAPESVAAMKPMPEPMLTPIVTPEPGPVSAALTPVPDGPRPPLTVPRSVWPGRAAAVRPAPTPQPRRFGPFTGLQWAGAVIVGGLGLLFAAAMAVLLVRVLLSLEGMRAFVATYPGEYELPDAAPVGIPAWLGWQHFFNAFLMVLIIRTGLTIRREKRPAVFWTPKNNRKGKTSLTIWFHQSLDLLWIVNGLVFVVLLFATGQWMRIVPTSWEVFPNALSAALQYVSLDWPTENGWVNYNSLQQLAYFTTVFVASPLAIATGYRMSALWPKRNAKLSAAYPIEWARKVHFPTMLFFLVFTAVHVFLVLATGALRNLNHMYAAQGSVDGVAYAENWTGFWFFVASLVVIALAWIAARPLVLAPIARLFGTVSSR